MPNYMDPASYWGLSPQQANTLPLGLRHSNNLFNIKYYNGAENNQAKWPGLLGPSIARDQGDPQMNFANVEDSGVAGAQLLRRKYDSGMRTPTQIIAGPSGWTPGRVDSANAVAGYAGVAPNSDLRLDTPEGMRNFLPALATQEHGTWARDKLYNSDMFDRIAERATGAQFATGELPKLDLLKEDGSNARRVWSDAPQRGDMSLERSTVSGAPQVASYEQRAPQSQGQGIMADQQQPKGILDGLAERATSPLFLAGLGAFASASQGNDWAKGMMEGAQTGGTLGNSAMQQVKLRRELERQKAADDLIKNLPNNPALVQSLPKEVMAGISALPPDQAAQALATVLTHRSDVTQQGALERQKAAIDLQKNIELAKAQRQINEDTWNRMLERKKQAGGQSQMPRVATPEELNALPQGARFIAPDGSIREKR